jgi:excisionase family DNA binding protein
MDLSAQQDIRRTVSVEEAAAMLGISRAKAYECARQGEIPSLRFGRRVVVPLAELERMLGSAIAEDE